MFQSPLKAQMFASPLREQLTLKPSVSRVNQSPAATLVLTSLVDAFSILVIYLIFNAANGSESLNLSKAMQLPFAAHSIQLSPAPVLKVENGEYFLNDQKFSMANMSHVLAELKMSQPSDAVELIVQADQEIDFEYLNPILLSASENGFRKFKFAVIQDVSAK